MIEAIEGLIAELRRVGIPIRLSESIDAAATIRHIDIQDRETLKLALGAVLVKDADHLFAYNSIFDLYFGGRLAGATQTSADGDSAADGSAGGQSAGQPGGKPKNGESGGGGGLDPIDDSALTELPLQALQGDHRTMLTALVRQPVDRHGGIKPGRAMAGTYYLVRTMRAVDPDGLLLELIQADLPAQDSTGQAADRQAQRRIDAVARTLRQPLPEDVSFLNASREQVLALRDILQPMTRKLASRLAENRRHQYQGSLDIRRTMRSSMSTGGVPLLPVFRRPRPSKPELVVLADISGSVSTFAAFTLQLSYALRSEFARVRDGMDEVTTRINGAGLGVWMDGRSDYGNAISSFDERFGAQIRSRSTVLVLGDAKTNYHAARADSLKSISRRAGRLYWLNPEPTAAWNSGDSVMGEYVPHCTEVVECRNVRQLKSFIERMV